jgi:hypothetical protein
MVGVAFSACLPVGHDVDSGTLHVADREEDGVVLGLCQELLADPPELARAHPRRQPGPEPGAVDQPRGLRVAADDGRGQ